MNYEEWYLEQVKTVVEKNRFAPYTNKSYYDAPYNVSIPLTVGDNLIQIVFSANANEAEGLTLVGDLIYNITTFYVPL